MLGLTFDKLLIIGVIAVFLLGPERLPHYAGQLAKLVRNLRDMANNAKDRMRDELGSEFDEVDWKKLDPRQYDPRRIIRDALLEDEDEPRITRPDPGATPVDVAADDEDANDVDARSDAASGADVASGEAASEERADELVSAANVTPPFDSEAT
ncbi:MAG: Sec-independent protein translocase TatB [Microbacteriaceae bacterium]|nr:MAG: Sec-independent protein translocase TatB [Microbacteriaceae bacterium]